jgi:hypothetical protein
MVVAETLTETDVQQLAKDWYGKLDVHVPIAELFPMLLDEGLEMRFPEATVTGWSGFEGWYERVIRIFFDEVHTVKKCDVTVSDGEATAEIVVKWEASFWNPPEARSQRIVCDAIQTWVVTRSPETGQPVVRTYIVNSIDYYEGSARL